MAKRQSKQETVQNYKWVKVIPKKGNARMEKRELVDGVQTGLVLETRKC